MEKKPFFTIGITVYNTEKYLERSIRSVLSQDFDDFEIVIINDGSSDNSAEIMEQYAANDRRIRTIHKTNGGVSSAKNAIIYHAEGRYLYLLDSDDTMCEGALRKAYDAIVQADYPDILQAGNIKQLYGEIIEYPVTCTDYCYNLPGLTADERMIRLWTDKVLGGSFDVLCTKFMKLETIRKNGISFSTKYFAQEDNDFAFALLRKTDSIAFSNFYIFCYYKYREGSLSTEWGYKAVSSVFSRWSDFFYNQIYLLDISDEYRKKVLREKQEFLIAVRRGIYKLGVKYSDKDVYSLVTLLEHYFEKDIKKLPMTKGPFCFIYPLFKVIGIRRTVKLLRMFVRIRDKIKGK